MSNVQTVEFSPVIIALTGASKTERKLSAVHQMGAVALVATAAMGGKAGKLAMQTLGETYTAQGFAEQAAWPRNDYRDLAAFIACQTGDDVVISSRASYLALPDWIETKLRAVRASKSGGMRVTSQGISEPNAAHKTLLGLAALVNDVHSIEREISTARRNEATERKAAEQRQISNEAQA
jgi:hypothetical protein